jgi:hypothetical protein
MLEVLEEGLKTFAHQRVARSGTFWKVLEVLEEP